MRLSELMSHMDMTFWPQVALVIFMGIFVGVLFRVFSRKRTAEYERAKQIPLADDVVTGERK
ncbi:MAG TPA: cbb3-type cytochrome c oxidase subunit 3 [Myxococcales bacterium LLY-WYZ-16_1]|nr:cbb3-type cytochrome c oxidase subunit 3 [Myxococcales bacterium LLY-WYZ-16_1]